MNCLGISKYRGDVLVEKGVDIMMATDLLQFAYRDLYDVAVLVSGDADFAYAMQAAKNLGKHVEVMAFPSNLSYELSQTADVLHVVDPEFFDDLWSTGPPRRKGHDGQPKRTVAEEAPSPSCACQEERRGRGVRAKLSSFGAGPSKIDVWGHTPSMKNESGMVY